MTEIFLSEQHRKNRELEGELLNLWISNIKTMVEVTRNRLIAFTKLHSVPHSSALTAGNIMQPISLAGSYQTTDCSGMPSGIIMDALRIWAADAATLIVTSSWVHKDQLLKDVPGARILQWEEVLADEPIDHQRTSRIVFHHDLSSCKVYKYDSQFEWRVKEKLFPSDNVNTTHIDFLFMN